MFALSLKRRSQPGRLREFRRLLGGVMCVLGALALLLPAELPPNSPVSSALLDASRIFGDVRRMSGLSAFPFALALSYGVALVLGPLLACLAMFAGPDRAAFEAKLSGLSDRKRYLGLLFLVLIVAAPYFSDTLEPSGRFAAVERLILHHRFGLLGFVEAILMMTSAVSLWVLFELSTLTRSLRR